jgi:aryl-alcohol dehydrogenase-like predicted oxidoreductase
MKHVRLRGTTLTSSRIGFGCAPVMGRVGKRQALRALETAYDVGITHYDVARSYGYGEAENILGDFLKGKREQVCIASKFGIRPTKSSLLLRTMKPLVRTSVSLFPGLKKRLQRKNQALVSGGHFSAMDARHSLEASLRSLKTDYVDIYFLHDCTGNHLLTDDLFHFLDRSVLEGKIRYYGIATGVMDIDSILAARSKENISVVQFANSVFRSASFQNRVAYTKAFVMHSPFGGQNGLLRMRHLLENDPAVRSSLEHALGFQLSDTNLLSRIILSRALLQANDSVILCSMFNERHIRQNARLVDSPVLTKDQSAKFDQFIKMYNLGEATATPLYPRIA